MDKKELAALLEGIGTLLELKGENPFKCNAYRNAARTIETLEKPLDNFQTVKDLTRLKGIGASLAEKILTLIQTGSLPYYDELKASVPSGLIEMIRIPGFGPKKARAVYEKLGISTVGELEYACRENRLIDLPGFGLKSQENILKGIEYLKKARGRFYLHEARAAAAEICESLAHIPAAKLIEVAGSLRRSRETVKDIDILMTASAPASLMDAFTSHPLVKDVIAHGETKSSVRLEMGINVDLRVVSDTQFPFALMYFTGSKEHNIVLRGRALRLGYKLNEYGLFKRGSKKSEVLKSEREIFARLGLAFIPPELREDRNEFAAAENGALPRLVTAKDIRGAIHLHTTYSDGVPTIAEYVKEAKRRGWKYIGISDHSKSAHYANGLSPERVKKQHAEIDALNKKLHGFRIFKGIESDILPDGSLDYADEILAQFDFVIASVHSKFKMPKKEMTGRIIRAMKNPYTTMLGHPTGRLLLARDGYEVDIDAIIDAAAKHNVIIELNANPFRLDLDWRHLRKAIEAGVLTSINPDAHRLENLDFTELGVGLARKGWCEARHVLNTRTIKEADALFKKRQQSL